MGSEEKPSVAILTALTDFSPSYSLVPIILEQARLLKRHGYPSTLFCLQYFNRADRDRMEHEDLDIQYVLPKTRLHDYKIDEPPKETDPAKKVVGFEDQATIHFAGSDAQPGSFGYKDVLEPYDVVITHDLMFIDSHLVQNAAVRKCIDLWPNKTWLHWIHSAPSFPEDNKDRYPSTLRFEAAPHSTYVYLNHGDQHKCALMLRTTRNNVSTVNNSRDIRDILNFSSQTNALIDEYDLLDHEILEVYPFSSPRWNSKGVKQLIRIFHHLIKDVGVKAKLVLVNANCNSERDKPHIKAIVDYVQQWRLQIDKDVILTSRFAEKQVERYANEKNAEKQKEWRHWLYSVPYRTVSELMQTANLFLFPSPSECCSLIQAEASVLGKFAVLNADFPPMLEFAHPSVLRFPFTVNNPDDRNSRFYEFLARETWAEMQNETALMNRTAAITRTYNRDVIFRKQLEPLLWKKAASRPKRSPDAPMTFVPPDRKMKLVEYKDPQPGDPCSIYGECSEARKQKCYNEAGHCLLLDEEKP